MCFFAFWGDCKVDLVTSIHENGGIATIVTVVFLRSTPAFCKNLPRTRMTQCHRSAACAELIVVHFRRTITTW